MNPQYSPHITKKLPIDSQGFTLSFPIDSFDSQKVRQFYNQFGFVVFNGVINQQEVNLTVDELWMDVKEAVRTKVDRQDPKTWNFENVSYIHSFLPTFGFVNYEPFSKMQMWKNRSNPRVYRAFKRLYQISSRQEPLKEPLFASFDRGSMLRPSKFNSDWRTEFLYHFDMDPWWWTQVVKCSDREWRSMNDYTINFGSWLGEGNYTPKVRNFTKLQGVLALSDTSVNSGGFSCVCGFQNYIKEWCSKTKRNTNIEQCPQLMNNFQKIYQRAGSLLVFSRQLPHYIYPNESEKFRYAQYLRMTPESAMVLSKQEKRARKVEVQRMLPKWLDLTDPIVRELYMLNESIQDEQ